MEYAFIDKHFSPITSDRAVGHDDALTVDAFISHLKENKNKNFFGIVHFNATHFPYLSHKKSDKYLPTAHTTDTTKKVELINAYDNAILYLDIAIGKVMKLLENEGLKENTIVVLVSDHAEAFGEHEVFFHTTSMFNETLNVPLLISIPSTLQEKLSKKYLTNLQANQKTYISNVDVMPTLLSLYGISSSYELDGVSLLEVLKRKYIFATTDANDITLTFMNTLTQDKYIFDNRSFEILHTNLSKDPLEKSFKSTKVRGLYNRKRAMQYIQNLKGKKQ